MPAENLLIFKVKYLGATQVKQNSGDHVVASAVMRIQAEKRESLKVFLIIREETLVVSTKGGEVLQNLDLACISFTSLNPADPKLFAFISEAHGGQYYCHVFVSKDKIGEAPKAIKGALSNYQEKVVTLLRQSRATLLPAKPRRI